MKIFELENDGRLRSARAEASASISTVPSRWDRRPPRVRAVSLQLRWPCRRGGAPSISAPSGKLKLHVLDLGKLRLDKNFMVANTTVATARNSKSARPDHRYSRLRLLHRTSRRQHPVRYRLPSRTGAARTGAGRSTGLQELFPHIGGEECMLPARLDMMGVGPDDVETCGALASALRSCRLRRIFPQVEDHRS